MKLQLSRVIAVILLAFYGFNLPEDFSVSGSEEFYRYLLFFLASHLLVSFGPYLGSKSIKDFWAYNKTLFLRILLSILYVGVLFNGLTIAIYSIEVLLEFDIEAIRYGQLAIFLNGIFGTWFFLAGVPHPDQLMEEEKVYPKGLKIFVQYVLMPLVVVYILILYLYMGKILIEWEWPNGWVANLILNFSIAGILSLLLLYPIQDKEDHKWVYLFSKGYYLALVPLVVLLMLSIWVRISEYGVTVNRYFVATLAVWLTAMVSYFLISKQKDIRIIPASLCLIAVLISFGPLGAFDVSERSQLSRLEGNLQKYGLISDSGNIIKTNEEIPFNDRKQISSSINYLIELKGVEVIQPLFDEDLNKVLENKDSTIVVSNAEAITNLIGIDYVNDWEDEGGSGDEYATFQYRKKRMEAVPVEDYQYVLEDLDLWLGDQDLVTYLGKKEYTISVDDQDYEVRITEKETGLSILFELKPFIATLEETGPGKVEMSEVETLTLVQEKGYLKVMLVFNDITGQRQGEEVVNVTTNFGLYFSFEDS